jgi:uncharacterized protein (DUF849 family)
MTPVIIEAAINGVTGKARNRHVPRTPEEIAADGLRVVAAGAAIVHNHLDEFSLDGPAAAERYLAGWRPLLAKHPDVIVYPTVGFGGSIEARFEHIDRLADSGLMRMGLLDPGSVNLGGLADDGLPGGLDFVYTNTFGDIRYVAALCERQRLGPSIAIFEPGFLRTTLAYHHAGRLPKGAFVKLYFGGDHDYLGGQRGGATFGLPPTRPALEAYLDLLEGSGLPWAVAVIGGDVTACGLAKLALARGGHVRVGLEDYAGPRTPTNEELVREVTALAAEVGRPVATCAEAARMLGLPR